MKFGVMIDQSLRFNCGVDLRRGDACVSEHFLDRAEIRSTSEQVRGERMSQPVRFDILRDASALGVLFHDHPKHHAG